MITLISFTYVEKWSGLNFSTFVSCPSGSESHPVSQSSNKDMVKTVKYSELYRFRIYSNHSLKCITLSLLTTGLFSVFTLSSRTIFQWK